MGSFMLWKKQPENPAALIEAVRAGHLASASAVSSLLLEGIDINYQDWETHNQSEDNGIDEALEEVDQVEDDTALMAAVRSSNLSIVQALISHKANVNKQNTAGDTALIIAARNGNIDIVQALLKAGAKRRIENNQGKTAIVVARESNRLNIVIMLDPPRSASPASRRSSGSLDEGSSSSRGFKQLIKACFSFRGLSLEKAFAKSVGVLLLMGLVGVACYFTLPALPVVGLTGLAAKLVWTGAAALAALSLFVLGNALSHRPTPLRTTTQRRFFYGKLLFALLCASPLVALALPFVPVFAATNAWLGNTVGLALTGWPAFAASAASVFAVPALVLGVCYRALRPRGKVADEFNSDLGDPDDFSTSVFQHEQSIEQGPSVFSSGTILKEISAGNTQDNQWVPVGRGMHKLKDDPKVSKKPSRFLGKVKGLFSSQSKPSDSASVKPNAKSAEGPGSGRGGV